eukprot:5638941-Pyramimonas_sp.AAC.1
MRVFFLVVALLCSREEKRRGPPGPGRSTGHEAPRWAAGRTGLLRPTRCFWAVTLNLRSRECHLRPHLVVSLEAAEQLAVLVVVGVLRQPLLRAQDLAGARHQPGQELGALRLRREQRPPHRRQPRLSQTTIPNAIPRIRLRLQTPS